MLSGGVGSHYCLPTCGAVCSAWGQNLCPLTFRSIGSTAESFHSELNHLRVLQRSMEHTGELVLLSKAHKPGTFEINIVGH